MTKEFVSYTQALALKELGFDEDCLARYEGKITNIFKPLVLEFTFANLPRVENKVNYPDYPYKDVEAPTYSQAFRFFREKHNLVFNFISYNIVKPREYHWSITWNDEAKAIGIVKTYEEAELACLKKLIEIVKEKK